MSATAITVAVKPIVTMLARKVGKASIERWTRYRANRFFESFVEAVELELDSGVEADEVDRRIDQMLTDATKNEVLFDAYRRVCFATSKNLGPRIVGLLTGRLVHEGRMANETEERVFAAAELLSDGDFIEFMKTYQEHRTKAKGVTDHKANYHMAGESVIVRWARESTEHSWLSPAEELDVGSLDFDEALGRWATKLKQSGLLVDRVQHQFIGSRMADTEFRTNVTTTITFHAGCARLYELLSRSLGPGGSAPIVN